MPAGAGRGGGSAGWPTCSANRGFSCCDGRSGTARAREAGTYLFENGSLFWQEQRFTEQVGGRANAGEPKMSILGWLILGLIAGFIASKIVNKSGEGVILDIVLGIVGAFVGGFLFTRFGAEGVTGFNLYSMFVAVVGAIVVLVLYHLIIGRRTV
jgi:uncharacterized membrane protein YeaQ/YmgE (transglycosylase-associated protein family)